MKIIISPAKKMEECPDLFEPGELPAEIERTERLYEALRKMSEEELKTLFRANDRITRENYLRYQNMDLSRAQTPALLSYVGIQYQYMAPKLFSREMWEYAKKHLRILSGFYGVLRPDDRIVPYRLEMQAKLSVNGTADLYAFWNRRILDDVLGETDEGQDQVIINLASKEYSRAVEAYLTPQIRYVTCIFGTEQDGKVKVKATEAKMARGEMVRFLAEKEITDVERIREFDRLGYSFSEKHSGPDCLAFIKHT